MIRVARSFLEAWFAIWRDEDGHRRTPAEAEQRYRGWHEDAAAADFAPLRKQQQHLDADHFARLSVFLRNPAWEPTTTPPSVADGPFATASIHTSASGRSIRSTPI